MPRYFFHVYNEGARSDREGQDCADEQRARDAAVTAAREMAAEDIRMLGRLSLGHRIEVRDEEGRFVFTLPFSQAFEIVT